MKLSRRIRWPGDYTVGIIFLLVVVFLWTVASFVAQEAFDTGFRKPFWITYLNSCTFALYLIPYAVEGVLRKYGFRVWGRKAALHEDYQQLPTDGEDESIPTETRPFTTRETFKLAVTYASPYFALNWAIIASLSYTSVTSSTILTSTGGFFTLLLGRLFHVEALTPIKVLAVATSFIGVVLVSISDSSSDDNSATSSSPPSDKHTNPAPILGDLLALLSAAIAAMYLVLFKRRVRDESRVDMRLLFGFMGTLNGVCMLPVGLLLHLLRAERFGLPGNARAVLAILTGMAVTFVGDVLYFGAMLKTTPVVASVGQSLTMPLAILGDFFLHKSVSVLAILGCVVVLASFGVLGLDARKEAKDTNGLGNSSGSTDGLAEEDMEMSSRMGT